MTTPRKITRDPSLLLVSDLIDKLIEKIRENDLDGAEGGYAQIIRAQDIFKLRDRRHGKICSIDGRTVHFHEIQVRESETPLQFEPVSTSNGIDSIDVGYARLNWMDSIRLPGKSQPTYPIFQLYEDLPNQIFFENGFGLIGKIGCNDTKLEQILQQLHERVPRIYGVEGLDRLCGEVHEMFDYDPEVIQSPGFGYRVSRDFPSVGEFMDKYGVVCSAFAQIAYARLVIDGVNAQLLTPRDGSHQFVRATFPEQPEPTPYIIDPCWNFVAPEAILVEALQERGLRTDVHNDYQDVQMKGSIGIEIV